MKFLTLSLAMAVTVTAAPSRLEQNITRVARSVNAQWGIYVKCLETGEEIAIDADRQMDTMSTIKKYLTI
jgi:beta-lactamase class A